MGDIKFASSNSLLHGKKDGGLEAAFLEQVLNMHLSKVATVQDVAI